PEIAFCAEDGVGEGHRQRDAAYAVAAAVRHRLQSRGHAGELERDLDRRLVTTLVAGAVRSVHGAGRRGEGRPAITVRADGFIDPALFAERVRPAVDVAPDPARVLAEEAAIELAHGVLLQDKEIKIFAVRRRLDRIRGPRQAGRADIEVFVMDVRPPAP